jgi:acyl-CoA dehydrogenase
MTYSFTLSKPLADYGGIVREWSMSECRPYARQADTDHAPPSNWKQILDTAPVGLGRQDIPDADPISSSRRWARRSRSPSGTPRSSPRACPPRSRSPNRISVYCCGAVGAEYVTVFATTDKSLGAKGIGCFVVPAGTPGLVITKPNESKLGIRSWQTSALSLDNCVIPVENRLAWSEDPNYTPRSSGQAGALAALGNNRTNMSAMAIGLAQASIDVANGILRERRAGFTPQRWAAIQVELENMSTALDRGRRMNFHAQYLTDAGKPDRTVSAAAKAYAPQTVDRIIRRCMQLLGPVGTSTDLLLEKWYRDVKIMDIFEGSSQVQRIIVGRRLVGRAAG